jgi:hypothetical protein
MQQSRQLQLKLYHCLGPHTVWFSVVDLEVSRVRTKLLHTAQQGLSGEFLLPLCNAAYLVICQVHRHCQLACVEAACAPDDAPSVIFKTMLSLCRCYFMLLRMLLQAHAACTTCFHVLL